MVKLPPLPLGAWNEPGAKARRRFLGHDKSDRVETSVQRSVGQGSACDTIVSGPKEGVEVQATVTGSLPSLERV